jgi:hypothetical protein
LQSLCPEGTPGHGNIRVLRHPDHNVFENAADMTLYWVCSFFRNRVCQILTRGIGSPRKVHCDRLRNGFYRRH